MFSCLLMLRETIESTNPVEISTGPVRNHQLHISSNKPPYHHHLAVREAIFKVSLVHRPARSPHDALEPQTGIDRTGASRTGPSQKVLSVNVDRLKVQRKPNQTLVGALATTNDAITRARVVLRQQLAVTTSKARST